MKSLWKLGRTMGLLPRPLFQQSPKYPPFEIQRLSLNLKKGEASLLKKVNGIAIFELFLTDVIWSTSELLACLLILACRDAF